MVLLRDYAVRNSEEAFATLVKRHIDRVYSVAWRHVRDSHHAEEITQVVFVILAQKARHLRKGVILEGWLYQTARFTALTHVRSEIRRTRREQEAQMQTASHENETDVWAQIAPLLDTALARLNETDRNALVLRFFYGKSMKDVGATLGAREDTARMRVNRALEKLREYFSRHGVTSTAETIAGAITTGSLQLAPVALAGTSTAAALANGTPASVSTSALIKGALKAMAWTKAKSALAAGAVALVLAGTATITVTEVLHHRLPGDAEIRQRIVGTWTPSPVGSSGATTIMQPDGNFFTTWKTPTNEIAMGGSWRVEGGYVVMTMTNVVGASPKLFTEPTQRYKIVQIGSREMVSYFHNPTNLTTMVRR